MSTSAASSLPPAYPARAPRGTAPQLRAWQQEALEAYRAASDGPSTGRDFLAVATPGAGKTTFALRVASDLLERGVVQALTLRCQPDPVRHLRSP